MKNKRVIILAGLALLFSGSLLAQNSVNNIQIPELQRKQQRQLIHLPDLDGYKTLKCDFHMHTIFSDGNVWPTVRLQEAWIDGLDAISITDHLEGSPYRRGVEGDDNTSYEIAKGAAGNYNMILVRGTEITRGMPPGHFNALFIEDANKIQQEDVSDAFAEAKKQGAFIIWNHPGWKAQQPDTCKQFDIHKEYIKKGWIDGVEVFNEKEWYPIALKWCIESNLAVIGNTDMHDLTAHFYNLDQHHRPMTLVFAKEKSEEALKEAMFARRTATWFSKYMAGPKKLLAELLHQAIEIEVLDKKDGRGLTFVEVRNPTDLHFDLTPEEGGLPGMTLKPHSIVLIKLDNPELLKTEKYRVTNWFVGMEEVLEVELLTEL